MDQKCRKIRKDSLQQVNFTHSCLLYDGLSRNYRAICCTRGHCTILSAQIKVPRKYRTFVGRGELNEKAARAQYGVSQQWHRNSGGMEIWGCNLPDCYRAPKPQKCILSPKHAILDPPKNGPNGQAKWAFWTF